MLNSLTLIISPKELIVHQLYPIVILRKFNDEIQLIVHSVSAFEHNAKQQSLPVFNVIQTMRQFIFTHLVKLTPHKTNILQDTAIKSSVVNHIRD